MKACPGLRSGMDSGPPFRHSGEGRNPGGLWASANFQHHGVPAAAGMTD